ncbi:MAG: Rrf2 family transcriptional regulator [Candidatus Omnitrophica bacterium]|nr:Rrf2 family transcriptional regulator [Candidatus Omnitrophota bacterium]
MKVTYKGDYALKAILALSLIYKEGEDSVLSIQQIANNGDMPTKFLEQILLILRRGGFVKSKRGLKGGFFLARSPDEITVGEVIRFIEGPIEPISCIERENYNGCKDMANCIFRSVWKEVAKAISMVVDTLTFEELVVRYKEKRLNLKSIYDYAI